MLVDDANDDVVGDMDAVVGDVALDDDMLKKWNSSARKYNLPKTAYPIIASTPFLPG